MGGRRAQASRLGGVSSGGVRFVLVPAFLQYVLDAERTPAFRPRQEGRFSVDIEDVACGMKSFFSFVVTEGPSVAFHSGLLSRAVRRCKVVNTDVPVDVRTVIVYGTNAVSATVRGYLSAGRDVRNILVDWDVKDNAVKTTARERRNVINIVSCIYIRRYDTYLTRGFKLERLRRLAAVDEPLLFYHAAVPNRIHQFNFGDFQRGVEIFLRGFICVDYHPQVIAFTYRHVYVSCTASVQDTLSLVQVTVSSKFKGKELLMGSVWDVIIVPQVNGRVRAKCAKRGNQCLCRYTCVCVGV